MAEERLDVVDENGRALGFTAEKKEAHLKGLWHQTADVWIYNSKGEILLQKRSMRKESYPGLLDVSAAGHVSAGETPIEAALRELEEELGIKATADSLKEVMVSKVSVDPKPGYHNNHIYYVYLMRYDTLPESIQKEEVDSVEFVPLDTFEKEIGDPEFAKKYVRHGYFQKLIRAIREELN